LPYSFHVGCGCYDGEAFAAAVISARNVFDLAQEHGFHFDLLDIGGGFPGEPSAKLSFEEVVWNSACDKLNWFLEDLKGFLLAVALE
jgi:diaminopimelate decarboxylase